ncbi:AmmeMemoRadiSam system radical SAM enzyme [Candidatus Woesearchaeota archaeon]|nr:AmmeMemoRadiSam system radical SAM enzyme [Candidatus Woesearchaeota archaeon]
MQKTVSLHEAKLYEKLEEKKVKCTACKWYCTIPEGKTGLCSIRGNKDGKLYLLVYGKAAAVHIDPIEKKPLFHFMPGTDILSIGTYGCNFGCEFCQNWEISQTTKHEKMKDMSNQFSNVISMINNGSHDLPPKEVVELCERHRIKSIAFTYNEPSIWSEYAHDIMKEAKKKGIKGIYVSSGYETKEVMDYMRGFIDAINIDLKAFSEETYRKVCKTRLSCVLDTIKEVSGKGIWIEITTLIIPTLNDSDEELEGIAKFIASVDKSIPWHVTSFHPDYKMRDKPNTPPKTLMRAHDIGKKMGLKYVYTGNIPGLKYENTYCPACKETIIMRHGMSVTENRLKEGKCPLCKERIEGEWG